MLEHSSNLSFETIDKYEIYNRILNELVVRESNIGIFHNLTFLSKSPRISWKFFKSHQTDFETLSGNLGRYHPVVFSEILLAVKAEEILKDILPDGLRDIIPQYVSDSYESEYSRIVPR